MGCMSSPKSTRVELLQRRSGNVLLWTIIYSSTGTARRVK